MHILQVCPRVPYPPHDGGAIVIYETARGLLAAGHRVTMLAINTPKHHQPPDALAHLGPNFRLVTVDVDTDLKPGKALRNLLTSALPYNVQRFISPAVARRLAQLLEREAVDVVQLEGTFVAYYAGWLRSHSAPNAAHVPLVLRAHNVEYVIWQRLARRERNPLKRLYLRHLAGRLRRFEQQCLANTDAVAAITAEDADRLRQLGCPEPIALIPAAVELRAFRPDLAGPPPRPRTVFMIGSLNWLPNLEGLDWLLRAVWPTAHAEMPELELHIAGSHPPAHLLAPRTDNVFVHGFVASAADFMRQHELMLVPLLSGGGMRVKIVEGMAAGKAILSTTVGAEGVAATDGESIVLRDGAAAWLAALRDYYHGRLPVVALGTAARAAAAIYDNRHVTEQFEALYRQLGAGF